MTLSNVKEFKNIFTVAETILTEIKLECDNDGMRFRGLDGGHTSFFEANFKKSYFTTYELDTVDNIIIDTNEINKIFKRIKNDDDISIIIDTNFLLIKVSSEKNEKTFKLNSVDMEYDSPNIPNIEYPVSFNINFKEFKETVTDANLYEDRLRMRVESDNLIIFNNSMMGEYESKLKLETSYEDTYTSTFAMDLINRIFKLTSLSNEISINMGTDMPMLMTLTDLFEDIEVRFLIAPRIEED